jgi:hypothetical protein
VEEVRGGPAGPFADLEVIRIEAGMPTTRFCSLIGVPERTWRRHQARVRAGRWPKGPWPQPARDRVREAARRHALAHPAWGHRKVWAMCRHDGLPVSAASVLRLLREEGLLLEASYQRERRQLVARRKAAFAVEPTGPNQVWHWTSPSSRPRRAGRGGWPGAVSTGASTSWAGTSRRRRISTTPSPRSSSPSPRRSGWPADRYANSRRATPTGWCCRW